MKERQYNDVDDRLIAFFTDKGVATLRGEKLTGKGQYLVTEKTLTPDEAFDLGTALVNHSYRHATKRAS